MSIAGKLVIAIAIGLVAAAIASLLPGSGGFNPLLAVLFIVATAGTALATHRPLAAPAAAPAARPEGRQQPQRQAPRREKAPAPKVKKPAPGAPSGGPRQEGSVKWFNAAKGFGFLTLEDGREVFVHFRSIRGEGRRSLRDGQRVSFIVADTDKGPQAEDVDPLD